MHSPSTHPPSYIPSITAGPATHAPPAISPPPPTQPSASIAVHPFNVPPPPSVRSDEWLEGLLDDAQRAVEGNEEEKNTGEVMEWQPTVGEKDEGNLISSQESTAMELEPDRTKEEDGLSSQEGKQPGASLLPGATNTAPPLPEPSHHHPNEKTDLLQRCIYNIVVCVVRCPAYYKPRYRLAAVLAEIGQTEVTQHTAVTTPNMEVSLCLSSLCMSGCKAGFVGAPPPCSRVSAGETPASLCTQRKHLQCE